MAVDPNAPWEEFTSRRRHRASGDGIQAGLVNGSESAMSPRPVIVAGALLLLFAGSEIGFRAGAWKNARRGEGDKTPTNAIMGSTLGLLAFMLLLDAWTHYGVSLPWHVRRAPSAVQSGGQMPAVTAEA